MNEPISSQNGNYTLSEHHALIFEQADKFAKNELYPLASRMDKDEWWPEDIFTKIGGQGYCGITIPEKFGGQGLDVLASGLIAQAIGRWNYALALSWIAHENGDLSEGRSSREGWISGPSTPPLSPAKAFSRSGCGQIFPLFSRVMREGLLTGPHPGRRIRVLFRRIFSGPGNRCAPGEQLSSH